MRYLQRSSLDVLEQLLPISAKVWRNSYDHLIEKDTKQIPINALGVALPLKHLRCKVRN